ncbi:MAG UNVERIFIED_CONTAM: hypothetical protein LVR18_51545 [Planctomycetaceae bacterium]|jgi:hypothetical protein
MTTESSRGGNLALTNVPGGYSTEFTKNLELYATHYLHLHEFFVATEKLTMRGGQTMVSRRAVLRNLATQMQADGPSTESILDLLSASVATVSGVKLELRPAPALRLEQNEGSGDQFAANSEIVLTAGTSSSALIAPHRRRATPRPTATS